MRKLLIIADDIAGALDSGVYLSGCGARTVVITDSDYRFEGLEDDIQVLVLDTETCHLPSEKAYQIVRQAAARAVRAGFSFIYKKTDSGLRGNIGSELAAALDGTGADTLSFIPAFPKMNRCTRDGIQYIDGVPVAQSVFGRDPFDPVQESSLDALIHTQTQCPVVLHKKGEETASRQPGIQVYDAETDEDMLEIGKRLGLSGLHLCAGCAGFARVLAEMLRFRGEPASMPELPNSLFVACGSMNPVTLRQMSQAEERGFVHVHLTPIQKLDESWIRRESSAVTLRDWRETAAKTRRFILDVNDPEGLNSTQIYAKAQKLTTEDLRLRISANLARLLKRLLDDGLETVLLCTGGDTLLAFMQETGITVLSPVCELAPGVVLNSFQYRGKAGAVISKSGGFGGPNLFLELAEKLKING